MSTINKAFLLIILLINISNLLVLNHLKNREKCRLTFFNVKQGDSALIQYQGINILIDGGDRISRYSQRSFLDQKLQNRFIRNIDLIILSHVHLDHLYGIYDYLQQGKNVKLIIKPPGEHTTVNYKKFMTLVRNRQIKLLNVTKGFKIQIQDLIIKVLSPEKGSSFTDLDNNSLVLKVKFQDKSVLFAGDIYFDREKWLVDNYDFQLKANYLKVAHHGSAKSSSQLFLKSVLPDISVISAGKNNRYGFPESSTIRRLMKWSKKIHITSSDGDLQVVL